MPEIPVVDVAGHLPSDLTLRSDLWPLGSFQSGAHVTRAGLSAFACRSEYPTPTILTVVDSERRLHLSVWLRQGLEVKADGWRFRVRGGQQVAGFTPGLPWTSHMSGSLHHVGLLIEPDRLAALAGEDGAQFFDDLRREDYLRVVASDAETMRAATELEAVLLDPTSLGLLREAKSLELLARLIGARDREASHQGLTRPVRDRLQHARECLLRDLATPPTLDDLASECGLNTFALKRDFKKLFGEPVFALYQRERMRLAWELLASGRLSATDAGSRVGYTNMSHFGAAFRRAHGVLPGEVRRRAQVAA